LQNKKIYFLAMAMLLCRGVAIAQLNESDTAKFHLRLSGTGSWQKGNVDLLVVRGKLELVTNGKNKLVFKSQNNSLYQHFGSFKADNDINSRNYLYYQPQKNIYPFAMSFAQTNYRRKVDYRVFGGLGVTYQMLRNSNNIVKLSASIVNERTRFLTNQFNETSYNGNNNITLWRVTMYVSGLHKLLQNKVRLFYNAYWQPAFEPVPNNRVQIDAGIELPVWKGLSVNAQYIYIYEQVVAQKVKQTDRILTFGVSYQMKK